MTDSIHDASDYKPSDGDNFFLDANIWLSVYGPVGNYNNWQVRHYSKLLSKLQNKSCNVYTNTIVISEYINRFARMEFIQRRECLGLKEKDFKKFRELEDFKQIAPEIAVNIRKIVRFSLICSYEISDVSLFEMADNFEKGEYDFNDLIITEICREKNLILVTDDGDFKDRGIEIVTANKHMLKRKN